MLYSQFKFNFYLNASHAIYIDGKLGQRHPHTWEITLNVLKGENQFVSFNDVEHVIESFLEPYQDKCLNDMEPFITVNPTLEHLTEFLLENIQKLLLKMKWYVFCIQVSETPARAYIISLVENNIAEAVQSDQKAEEIIAHAYGSRDVLPQNQEKMEDLK